MNILTENEIKRRLKISNAMKGRRPIAAILANTRRKCSEITKIKIGLGNKGKGALNRKNYKHSNETIEKIRKANTGKIRSEMTKEKQSLIKLQNPVRYWLGKKRNIATIEKMKLSRTGIPSFRKGMSYVEEYGKDKAQKIKEKMSNSKKGWEATDIQRQHYSKASKKKWEDPEYRKKVLAVNLPNKAEKLLQEDLNKIGLKEYEYVGDGKLRIGRKIPDFIDKKNNKIIELFGENFHERIEEVERKEYFKEYGYNTLIIWSKDLFKNKEQTLNKIIEFAKI